MRLWKNTHSGSGACLNIGVEMWFCLNRLLKKASFCCAVAVRAAARAIISALAAFPALIYRFVLMSLSVLCACLSVRSLPALRQPKISFFIEICHQECNFATVKTLKKMKINRFLFSSVAVAGLALCGCTTPPASPAQGGSKPAAVAQRKTVNVPGFSADTAMFYIKQQCVLGPRVTGSAASRSARKILAGAFSSYGLNVTQQQGEMTWYDGKKRGLTNIVAAFHPERNHRVALFAHYDSRPFADADSNEKNMEKPIEGANDGASGAGVLVEVARCLQQQDPGIGVDIVLFDAEDVGAPGWVGEAEKAVEHDWCLGSQYWSRNTVYTSANKPKFGILLDMVGGNDPQFCVDMVSRQYAGQYADGLWSTAAGFGFGHIFSNRPGGSLIDDHYYVNTLAQIPTFDIIDYREQRGFPSTWHTQDDTFANLSSGTVDLVGHVLVKFLYEYAAK